MRSRSEHGCARATISLVLTWTTFVYPEIPAEL
jgi:hypothetical protein